MNAGPKLVEVYTAEGMLDAETIRLYLLSYEIKATVFQESAGIVYGLTVGELGAAHIYVEEKDFEFASQLIKKLADENSSNEEITGEDLDTEDT